MAGEQTAAHLDSGPSDQPAASLAMRDAVRLAPRPQYFATQEQVLRRPVSQGEVHGPLRPRLVQTRPDAPAGGLPPLRRVDSRSSLSPQPLRLVHPAAQGVGRLQAPAGSPWHGAGPRLPLGRAQSQAPLVRPALRAPGPHPQALAFRSGDVGPGAVSPGTGVDASRPPSRPYIASGNANIVQEGDPRASVTVTSRGFEGHQQVTEPGKPKPRLFSIVKGKLYSLEGKPGLIQNPKQLAQVNAPKQPDLALQSPAHIYPRIDTSYKMEHRSPDMTKQPSTTQLPTSDSEMTLNSRPTSGLDSSVAKQTVNQVANIVPETLSSRELSESNMSDKNEKDSGQDNVGKNFKNGEEIIGLETHFRRTDETDKVLPITETKPSPSLVDEKKKQEINMEVLQAETKESSHITQDKPDRHVEVDALSEKVIDDRGRENVQFSGAKLDSQDHQPLPKFPLSTSKNANLNGINGSSSNQSEIKILQLDNSTNKESRENDMRGYISNTQHLSPESNINQPNGNNYLNGYTLDESFDALKNKSQDNIATKDRSYDSVTTSTTKSSTVMQPTKSSYDSVVETIETKPVLNEHHAPEKAKGKVALETEASSVQQEPQLRSRIAADLSVSDQSLSKHTTEDNISGVEKHIRSEAVCSPTKDEGIHSEINKGKPHIDYSSQVASQESMEVSRTRKTSPELLSDTIEVRKDKPNKPETNDSQTPAQEHQESPHKTKSQPLIFESKFSEDLRFEAKPRASSETPDLSGNSLERNGQAAGGGVKVSSVVSKSPSSKQPSLEETTVEAEPCRSKPSSSPDRDRASAQSIARPDKAQESALSVASPVSSAETRGKRAAPPKATERDGDVQDKHGLPKHERVEPQLTGKPPGDLDRDVDDSPPREGVLSQARSANGGGSPQKARSRIPAALESSKSSPSSSKSSRPAPDAGDKKKVPMNKVQVGGAPSPNLKTVRSKIGSLENTSYKPGGGKVKIEHRKLDFSKTQPKIAAKNDAYVPGGGDKKITQVKLQWNAKPKVGSLDNATHKPGGGDKKIESVKLGFKDKAKPKIDSKENVKYQPGGGAVKNSISAEEGMSADLGKCLQHRDTSVQIEDQKLDVKASSKVGSLANVKHKPGGGERKIFDDKDYLKQTKSSCSVASSEGQASGAQSPEPGQQPAESLES